MRRVVLLGMVGILGVLPVLSRAATRGLKVKSAERAQITRYDPDRFHALIIGIDRYKHWSNLRSAVNDAKTLSDVLRRNFGYRHVSVLLNEQATRQNILRALDGYTRLGETESLLIYYAGHGWMDENRNGFWVPTDAGRGNKFDYISNSRIKGDFFRKYKVKHLLIVADSCFSGSLLRGGEPQRQQDWKLPSGFRKPSRWVMTSGDLAPVEDDDGAGHSPFATRMLQFLKYSERDAFGVQDLYVYMRQNLKSEPICNPMSSPQHMPGGEFVFCRLDQPVGEPIPTTPRTRRPVSSGPRLKQTPAREQKFIVHPKPASSPKPAPAPEPKTGTLVIECTDYGVAIISGQGRRVVYKDRPLTWTGLPTGLLKVQVVSKRRSSEQHIMINPGRTSRMVVAFPAAMPAASQAVKTTPTEPEPAPKKRRRPRAH